MSRAARHTTQPRAQSDKVFPSRVTRQVTGIMSAKLNASAALAASGVPHCGMNYAVKSPDVSGLSFLESAPGVEARLIKPNAGDQKFEDVVRQTQKATALVFVH